MGRFLISLVIALALVIVFWNLLRDGSDEGVDAGEEAVAASPVDDGAEPEGRDPLGIDLPADPEQPSSAPEPRPIYQLVWELQVDPVLDP